MEASGLAGINTLQGKQERHNNLWLLSLMVPGLRRPLVSFVSLACQAAGCRRNNYQLARRFIHRSPPRDRLLLACPAKDSGNKGLAGLHQEVINRFLGSHRVFSAISRREARTHHS
jgi:hypothetical protein